MASRALRLRSVDCLALPGIALTWSGRHEVGPYKRPDRRAFRSNHFVGRTLGPLVRRDLCAMLAQARRTTQGERRGAINDVAFAMMRSRGIRSHRDGPPASAIAYGVGRRATPMLPDPSTPLHGVCRPDISLAPLGMTSEGVGCGHPGSSGRRPRRPPCRSRRAHGWDHQAWMVIRLVPYATTGRCGEPSLRDPVPTTRLRSIRNAGSTYVPLRSG
jgi:hypothetical protein